MKKEPKRSRKKKCNYRDFGRKSKNDADNAYGHTEFEQKADTERNKGIAGTRCTGKRRL